MDPYDDGQYGDEDGLDGSKGDKTQEEDDGSVKGQNEGGEAGYEGGDKEDDGANADGGQVNNTGGAQLPP